MRAFVAVLPPPTALAELETAVAPLRDLPGLRWTPPAQWHLTLAFLGEIDEAVLPPLTERLARAARRHAPVSLALAGGGRFGNRVLWTRVHGAPAPPTPRELRISPRRVAHPTPASPAFRYGESSVPARRVERSGTANAPPGPEAHDDDSIQAVRRLAASVTAAARRCRIDVDERPYRPHLTLARTRDGADLRPAVAVLSGFEGSPWTAEALHLVRSRLGVGPGGTAAHEVVETWPLGR